MRVTIPPCAAGVQHFATSGHGLESVAGRLSRHGGVRLGGCPSITGSSCDQGGSTFQRNLPHDCAALADHLTGLPHRRAFSAELAVAQARAKRTGTALSVALLDLDSFKLVNDFYGHTVGDALIEAVADRLVEGLAPSILIARLGGDEFGLLFEGTAVDCSRIAVSIANIFREPFPVGRDAIKITASVGFATNAGVDESVDELLCRADRALHLTKADDHGSHTIYWKDLADEALDERRRGHALLAADLERELDIVFQPIVDLHSLATVAVEVLARWTSPTLGTVPPDVFIPLAERIGRVGDLTRTIVKRALALAPQLPDHVAISINISAHDLHSPAIVNFLIREIGASGIAAERIWIEITETAAMRNMATAVEAVNRLRGQGIKIALDDFGTGFSSLSQLSRLPVDKIKIDRGFTAGLDQEVNRNIVCAITSMSESLGMKCVVEGIETPEQLAYYRDHSCEYGQGYLFARPLSFPTLLAHLAREQVARDHATPHGKAA